MRVFIAGATGVLGRRMVRQFSGRGHSVVGLARDEKGRQTIRRLGGESFVGDIFDAGSLAAEAARVLRMTEQNMRVGRYGSGGKKMKILVTGG